MWLLTNRTLRKVSIFNTLHRRGEPEITNVFRFARIFASNHVRQYTLSLFVGINICDGVIARALPNIQSSLPEAKIPSGFRVIRTFARADFQLYA